MLHESQQNLPVVYPDDEPADADLRKDRLDYAGDFGIGQQAQRSVADHVDVALVEFAEPPGLRPLAAPHLLDLIAAERKGEFGEMLGDVAGQRHGEVEMQRHLGGGVLARPGGQPRQGINLLLHHALGRQHLLALDRRGLDRREAEPLELGADHPEQPLLDQLLLRQPLRKAADRLGFDDGLGVGHAMVSAIHGAGSIRLNG